MNEIICLSLKDNAAEIAKLSTLNKLLLKNSLILKPNDIERLIITKNTILHDLNRVEINNNLLYKIINEFCTSPFLEQDNFITVVEEITELVYLFEAKISNVLTDDEIIHYLKSEYEKYEGCLDLVLDFSLNDIINKIGVDNKYE